MKLFRFDEYFRSSYNIHMSHLPEISLRFIVLEGIDGCGKSTQVQLLGEWLREAGYTVTLTREPGGTALAERLRALILDQTITCSPRAELLMLLAARAQHVAEVITPALDAGGVVICDRFTLSSLAYQGAGRGLPEDEILAANATATGGVMPDLTIVLDVPLKITMGRIGERQDRFEGEGAKFLTRVLAAYDAATGSTVMHISGSGTVTEVQAAIRREILSRLNGEGVQ